MRRVVLASLLLATPALLGGCLEFGGPLVDHHDEAIGDESEGESETDAGVSDCGPTVGIVDYAVDGDTLVLTSGERVRLILVDTPETTKGKHECWGDHATQFTANLVSGREIRLEYDEECLDIYGRLLAYVSVDGVEVNRTLLEQGEACLLYIPPNGMDRVFQYQELEQAARNAGMGMWGECAPVPCE
ncbi:MAG: thermonuclease [Deltaproteobacteria bacterium]|nr:thermonuclease [Deltaproteobacteria bacterium]